MSTERDRPDHERHAPALWPASVETAPVSVEAVDTTASAGAAAPRRPAGWVSTGLSMLGTPLILRSGISLIDQALLSILNFAVSIVLIRTVSKVEYGYYSVALAASLFLISLQNALVNSPLTVLLAAKRGAERHRYLGGLYHGQVVAVLPVAALGLATIALLRWWGLDPHQAAVAGAVCAAAVGSLSREFMLSYLFAAERPGRVLAADAMYAFSFVMAAAAAYYFVGITVPFIILTLGASGLGVALWGLRGLRWRWQWDAIGSSMRENWRLGRWALVGGVVTHVQSYSYMYLLAGFVGGTAVADVSAARLLLSPLMLLQTAWIKIVVPHGARSREEGRTHRFFGQLVVGSAGMAVAGVVYVVMLLGLSGVLLRVLLPEKYATCFEYMPLWGVVLILTALELNASGGLQVMRRFGTLATVDAVVMIITVSSALVLIHGYGAKGGLVALAIGEGILTVVVWFCLALAVFEGRGRGSGNPG